MVNMIYGFMDTPRKPRCIYHSGGISYFWGQNRKASAHNVSLAAHFFWLPWSGASWVHTTGSKHYQRIHLEVIYHLCDVVRCKQLNLWTMVSWQLIHDNTLANFSPVIHSFLSKHNIHLVRQSPSSLKMVASDLWLFPRLKLLLKMMLTGREKTVWEMWWLSCTPFQKWPTWNASNNDRATVRSVCSP